jgi:hypothetical protein
MAALDLQNTNSQKQGNFLDIDQVFHQPKKIFL